MSDFARQLTVLKLAVRFGRSIEWIETATREPLTYIEDVLEQAGWPDQDAAEQHLARFERGRITPIPAEPGNPLIPSTRVGISYPTADAALRRAQAGESVKALAAELGCTVNALYYALDRAEHRQQRKAS